MKILITGSNGLLGQKLVYKLRNKTGIQCIATARGENRLIQKEGYTYESLDITNAEQVKHVYSKFLPDVVINTAAMTNVDECETKREECWGANVTALENFVTAIGNAAIHLVHLSTDFVFDGEAGAYK